MNATYLLFLNLLAAGLAHAQENRWSNGRGGGKWENGANWSLDIPPNMNHDVVIAAALSETVTIDATTAAQPANMVVKSLRVGREGNVFIGTDTLRLLNAGLTTPLTVLASVFVARTTFARRSLAPSRGTPASSDRPPTAPETSHS
jgi:hypothetical protein